ncbi:MAG: extracellular solute-binding protein [Rhizobiaceae bacterium]
MKFDVRHALAAAAVTAIFIGGAWAEPKHGIAIIGDPALPAGFANLPYVNPAAPQGGNIGYGVVGTFDNLNPFILKSMRTTARGVIDTSFGNLVFESLMVRSADEPFTLYGLLAESIDTDEGRTFAEFQLNPNAKWSDGTPVTPEDVIFTYETYTAKGRPPYSKRMDKIAKIEKTGEHGVKFTFNEKSDREFPLIIALTPIIPKHASAAAFDEPTLNTLIGSGPYLIDKIEPGTRITFRKNPEYWGKDLNVKKGIDNFASVSIDYFKDGTAQFEAFKKGLFDVYPEGDPAKWEKNYTFDAVTSGKVKKEAFTAGTPSNMFAFFFNTRRPVFTDRKVRMALAMLYDFEWTNKNLFEGKYARTGSFWQNSELSALGKPASDGEKALLANYTDKLLPEVMDGTWKPSETDGSGRDRETILKAVMLLKEAGFVLKDRKMIGADGKPLAFEILCANGEEEKLALVYQRTLAKVGIDAQVRTVDDAQYQQRRQTWDYDMSLGTFSASLSPGIEQVGRWGSSSKDGEGTFNYAGVAEPGVDAMIDRIGKAKSRAEYVDGVRALDRLLISGQYVVPLHHLKEQWIARWDRVEHPETTPLFGYQLPTWWAKQ